MSHNNVLQAAYISTQSSNRPLGWFCYHLHFMAEEAEAWESKSLLPQATQPGKAEPRIFCPILPVFQRNNPFLLYGGDGHHPALCVYPSRCWWWERTPVGSGQVLVHGWEENCVDMLWQLRCTAPVGPLRVSRKLTSEALIKEREQAWLSLQGQCWSHQRVKFSPTLRERLTPRMPQEPGLLSQREGKLTVKFKHFHCNQWILQRMPPSFWFHAFWHCACILEECSRHTVPTTPIVWWIPRSFQG